NLPPPPPPPLVPFVVRMWYPVNGQSYIAPVNVALRARVSDSNVVQTVEFFSGDASLGIVTNVAGVLVTNLESSNPFYLIWSNVLAGSYTLKAVATDSAGNSVTSAPVNITVTNRPPVTIPFVVGLVHPTNGQMFAAPANVGIRAVAIDSNIVQ